MQSFDSYAYACNNVVNLHQWIFNVSKGTFGKDTFVSKSIINGKLHFEKMSRCQKKNEMKTIKVDA